MVSIITTSTMPFSAMSHLSDEENMQHRCTVHKHSAMSSCLCYRSYKIPGTRKLPIHQMRYKKNQKRLDFSVLPHHRLRVPLHGLQVGQTGAVLAGLSSAQRTGSRNLDHLSTVSSKCRLLQSSQERLGGLGREILIVIVVDLDHGGIDTGSKALNLDKGEEAVLSGVTRSDSEVLSDGLDDLVTAAATELAGSLSRVANQPKFAQEVIRRNGLILLMRLSN